jgi:hypothetical protein
MLLFYVDESGGTGPPSATSARSRYFALAAVGIRDSSREAIAREIRTIRVKYFGAKVVEASWDETEIKARYIQASALGYAPGSKLGPPEAWAAVAQGSRLGNLTRDIEKVFAKFRPVVFAVVVDKHTLAAGESPVAVAYAKLYREVALRVGNVYVGESALLVADRQDEHQRLFASGDVHATRKRLAPKTGTKPDFNLLIDTPIWLDPTISTWDREIIQLADLVALAAREWASSGGPPSMATFMWRAITPCFALDWHETTATKSGLSIYPPPVKYPPLN